VHHSVKRIQLANKSYNHEDYNIQLYMALHDAILLSYSTQGLYKNISAVKYKHKIMKDWFGLAACKLTRSKALIHSSSQYAVNLLTCLVSTSC